MIDRQTLKQWFSRGKKPTGTQFAEWIDSYWHKNDTLPTSAVENLTNILADKAENATLDAARATLDARIDQTDKNVAQNAGQISQLADRLDALDEGSETNIRFRADDMPDTATDISLTDDSPTLSLDKSTAGFYSVTNNTESKAATVVYTASAEEGDNAKTVIRIAGTRPLAVKLVGPSGDITHWLDYQPGVYKIWHFSGNAFELSPDDNRLPQLDDQMLKGDILSYSVADESATLSFLDRLLMRIAGSDFLQIGQFGLKIHGWLELLRGIVTVKNGEGHTVLFADHAGTHLRSVVRHYAPAIREVTDQINSYADTDQFAADFNGELYYINPEYPNYGSTFSLNGQKIKASKTYTNTVDGVTHYCPYNETYRYFVPTGSQGFYDEEANLVAAGRNTDGDDYAAFSLLPGLNLLQAGIIRSQDTVQRPTFPENTASEWSDHEPARAHYFSLYAPDGQELINVDSNAENAAIRIAGSRRGYKEKYAIKIYRNAMRLGDTIPAALREEALYNSNGLRSLPEIDSYASVGNSFRRFSHKYTIASSSDQAANGRVFRMNLNSTYNTDIMKALRNFNTANKTDMAVWQVTAVAEDSRGALFACPLVWYSGAEWVFDFSACTQMAYGQLTLRVNLKINE